MRWPLRKGEAWQEQRLQHRGYAFGGDDGGASDGGPSDDGWGPGPSENDAASNTSAYGGYSGPSESEQNESYSAQQTGLSAVTDYASPVDLSDAGIASTLGQVSQENAIGFGVLDDNAVDDGLGPATSNEPYSNEGRSVSMTEAVNAAARNGQEAPAEAVGFGQADMDDGTVTLGDKGSWSWEGLSAKGAKNGSTIGSLVGVGPVVGGLVGAVAGGFSKDNTVSWGSPQSMSGAATTGAVNAGGLSAVDADGLSSEGSGATDSSNGVTASHNGEAQSRYTPTASQGLPADTPTATAAPATNVGTAGTASYGQDAYNWFNKLYADLAPERQRVADAATNAISNANTVGGLNVVNAQTDRNTYNNTFTPTLNKIVADANQFDSHGEAERLAQEGEAGVGKTFGQLRSARERQLQSYNLNPASTKYQTGLDALSSQEASARAAAANAGRIQGRDIGTQKLVQAANLSAPLAGQATTEGNAALVAGQAGTSAATIPGAVTRSDAALVSTGTGLAMTDKNQTTQNAISAQSAANQTNATGAQIAASQAVQSAAQNATNNANTEALVKSIPAVVEAGKSLWDLFK